MTIINLSKRKEVNSKNEYKWSSGFSDSGMSINIIKAFSRVREHESGDKEKACQPE